MHARRRRDRNIKRVEDDEEYIVFDTRDEHGELTQLPFGPFDTVEEVLAEDDEDVTVEDIEVDI